MMRQNNLQDMIMIPKELFDKFKKLLGDETELTNIDKRLKDIMLDEKLNEYDRWLLYRQAILQKPNKRNGGGDAVTEKIKPTTTTTSTNTTTPSKRQKEKVYEIRTNKMQQQEENNEENKDEGEEEEEEEVERESTRLDHNYALEELYDKKALSVSSPNSKLKKITSPYSKKKYRVFENSATGEQITVFLSGDDDDDYADDSFVNSKIIQSPQKSPKKNLITNYYRKNRLRPNPKQKWASYPS
jgi:hypothetical protein